MKKKINFNEEDLDLEIDGDIYYIDTDAGIDYYGVGYLGFYAVNDLNEKFYFEVQLKEIDDDKITGMRAEDILTLDWKYYSMIQVIDW